VVVIGVLGRVLLHRKPAPIRPDPLS
jgi:hypothetical protein